VGFCEPCDDSSDPVKNIKACDYSQKTDAMIRVPEPGLLGWMCLGESKIEYYVGEASS
jgi:hypothetical protein